MQNAYLNAKYVPDVEAMLLKHRVGHGSESERRDSSPRSTRPMLTSLYHALSEPGVTQMKFN